MAVKKCVFGSGRERENYYKLRRQWGASWHIYHNLPFLNLFSTDDLVLSDIERNRLKKTSIDYTLCGRGDRPLLSVEFDGLYDGVNIGSKYYPAREPDSDWREQILSLKVRVAEAAGFPFFIVGNDLFKDLSSELKLTIVDGIIGEVLATLSADSELAKGLRLNDVGWSAENFERLDRGGRQAVLDYWGDAIVVRAEMAHNPIYARAMQLIVDLGHPQLDVTFRQFPEATPDPMYVGATVTVSASDCGKISQTIMLPHFKTPGFPLEYSLPESIGMLLCLEEVRRVRGSP